jgi:hypothetical protein
MKFELHLPESRLGEDGGQQSPNTFLLPPPLNTETVKIIHIMTGAIHYDPSRYQQL